MKDKLDVISLQAWFGTHQVLQDVNLAMPERAVTAIIGPSGCGKSTLIRCLNRMHEVVPGARASGKVLLDGEDIYVSGVDPVQVRARIGMVFQRPNPFPTMSVFDNVAAGLRLNGVRRSRRELAAVVEHSLDKRPCGTR
jgi:phosphate transport system ATP-binding protein